MLSLRKEEITTPEETYRLIWYTRCFFPHNNILKAIGECGLDDNYGLEELSVGQGADILVRTGAITPSLANAYINS